jgi:hypothetical protein
LSVKKNFLNRSSVDDIDSQDNLIEIEKSYRPGPTAMRVHGSQALIRLLRGGLGSGKTRCGCEHVDELARAFPGSLHLIARKDLTSLKNTTQKVFLEDVVIPETIADFNIHESTLYYKNGSVVLFRETKDPDKVLSLELTSFLLDEATENDNREIIDKLRYRLRQKITVDGKRVIPPYAGLLVFNPPGKNHWLYELSQEHGVEDIQFSTYENRENLPPGYIEDVVRTNPPWEVKRLVEGEWGIEVKGKPVIWGFGPDHVRPLKLRLDLPIIRHWDFGFGRPCCNISQFDPTAGKRGRFLKHRELLGHNEKLPEFTPRVLQMTAAFCQGMPIYDYGDTHGSDNKDVGETSIEYLRIHHGIHVNHRRQRIKAGLEDIQELVNDRAPLEENNPTLHPCFMVDPMCPIAIDAYTYGYHKDPDGLPVKDGYFDHPVDTDRYGIIGVRNRASIVRAKKKIYRPANRYTGY